MSGFELLGCSASRLLARGPRGSLLPLGLGSRHPGGCQAFRRAAACGTVPCDKIRAGARHHADGTHLNAAGIGVFAKALAEGPPKDRRMRLPSRPHKQAPGQEFKPDLLVSDSTVCRSLSQDSLYSERRTGKTREGRKPKDSWVPCRFVRLGAKDFCGRASCSTSSTSPALNLGWLRFRARMCPGNGACWTHFHPTDAASFWCAQVRLQLQSRTQHRIDQVTRSIRRPPARRCSNRCI